MWQISRMVGMAFLTGLSVEDMRFRKVSGELLVMMAVLGISYRIYEKNNSWISMLCGIGIGVIFLIISYITREALGYGDSILIIVLGLFVGAVELIEILTMTWIVLALSAMILLTFKRFSRKTALPFVPFLTLGYGVTSVYNYIIQYAGGA